MVLSSRRKSALRKSRNTCAAELINPCALPAVQLPKFLESLRRGCEHNAAPRHHQALRFKEKGGISIVVDLIESLHLLLQLDAKSHVGQSIPSGFHGTRAMSHGESFVIYY